MTIKLLVLDFDGTCTDIPAISDPFLDAYLARLVVDRWTDADEWRAALKAVWEASPDAGWTLSRTASAPAAADPYILAGEAMKHIARRRKTRPPEPDPYVEAYNTAPAPFRPEFVEVLRAIDARGVAIRFVSNSSTTKVAARLADVLKNEPELLAKIPVHGDAEKFVVCEPAFDDEDIGEELRAAFEALPAAGKSVLRRPIYLRRASYLKVLAKVWNEAKVARHETIVCGDVFELDLALPAALGCATHLVERAEPYGTYAYERALAADAGTSVSADLNGLLARLA